MIIAYGLNSKEITAADNGGVVSIGPMAEFTGITAKWNGTATPAGTLTFTVDGDGVENNVMDLGAGQRTIGAVMVLDDGQMVSMPLAFVDVAVSGIPAGGSVTLYFR